MTTHADDCAEQPHTHVGLCQRAGYANGLADAAEPPESTLAAMLADHEHLFLRDLRRHPEAAAEVRLHVDGKLRSGTWPAQVTASIDAMLGTLAARIAQLEADLAAAEAKLRAVVFRVEVACDGYSSLTEADVPDEEFMDFDSYIAGAKVAAAIIRAALTQPAP